MSISATDVKTLRDRTNAPMMECKAALTEAGGDMEKAVQILREKHKGVVDKRVGNETAEGRVGCFIDPVAKVAAIVELRCESAPTAKSDLFVALANDLAKHAATKQLQSVEQLISEPLSDAPTKTGTDRINEVIGVIRENMKPARVKAIQGVAGGYVHHDGTVGVLLQVEGENVNQQTLRDVCMHIAARSPAYARREEVGEDVIAREKEVARAQLTQDPKNAGKPANILEKIIEGKINTWFAETVLLDQLFVKDDSKSVSQVLQAAGAKFVGFTRYKIGELS